MDESRSPSSPVGDESDIITDDQHAKIFPAKTKIGPTQSSKAGEKGPVVIPLENYLPLGCLEVNLLESQHWIDSEDFVEAIDFLPHLKDAPALSTALTILWRAMWLKVFRSSARSGLGHELWRLYILPDVCGLGMNGAV